MKNFEIIGRRKKMNLTHENSVSQFFNFFYKSRLFVFNNTTNMDEESLQQFENEQIEFELCILSILVLLLSLTCFLSIYVCFFKWVAKGNLDLPQFHGRDDCIPRPKSLRKTESTQVLQDNLENTSNNGSLVIVI